MKASFTDRLRFTARRIAVAVSERACRWETLSARVRRLHHDEQGAISVLTVFAVFLFTILLVQVINVGRQIDDKLRMQNAADAASYSGATVLARGMNAIAFSNHMLCETFALTAYMREGRDRKSESLVPQILDAWNFFGTEFATKAGHYGQAQKFKLMGEAVIEKVRIERDMVQNFGDMTFHQSRITLPLFEYILAGPDFERSDGIPDRSPDGGFIPRFQRAIVKNVPHMASVAANDIAKRYGERSESQHRNEPLRGLLWQTNVTVVGAVDQRDVPARTLPVVDPSRYARDLSQVEEVIIDCPTCLTCYECISRTQRHDLAHHYLRDWIRHWMSPYFEYPDDGSTPPYRGATTAKLSQMINLWRIFTCANLNELLNEEYPFTNLPFVLRDPPTFPDGCVKTPLEPDRPCEPPKPIEQSVVEGTYNFAAVTYWPHQKPIFPGLFQNPIDRDSQTFATTFAQSMVFLPRGRFQCCPWGWIVPCSSPSGTCCIVHYDSAPGAWNLYSQSNTSPGSVVDNLPYFAFDARWERFGRWDMFNQNWSAKLVPATAYRIPEIVSQHPANHFNGSLQNYQAPRLGNTSPQQFNLVNSH